jgi:hypothetical protein
MVTLHQLCLQQVGVLDTGGRAGSECAAAAAVVHIGAGDCEIVSLSTLPSPVPPFDALLLSVRIALLIREKDAV